MATSIAAEPITAEELSKKIGKIRRAAKADEDLVVTFHGRPMSRIVPDARWQETQAELARLRTLVAERGLAVQEEAAVA